MQINEVDASIIEWLFAANSVGPIPSAEACETLMYTAPIEAEGTAEYRFIGLVMRWREQRLSDEEVLRRATAWWETEDARAAA